ncbi:serine hydrolase [uncultured Draconibacterium sp.]|uniref:serine hydrolase n=1 Tax=uncultured Draconibacterium sp. TaxID=1573823 RepID=UPI003216B746
MKTLVKGCLQAKKVIRLQKLVFIFMMLFFAESVGAYPIDGFFLTGIRRLVRLQLVLSGDIKDTKPIEGARKSINDIHLQLLNSKGDSLATLPTPDPELQKKLNVMFPNLDESYSLTLLDITPGKKLRYACRQEIRGFQPGSVGKLAVLSGLFTELQRIYPESFEKRQDLLKTKFVRAGRWAISDVHTVPFFDPETKVLVKRTVKEEDVFSLYEWVDHMVSVSNNGAASVVWREVLLMRQFGKNYPGLTEEQANEFFKTTPRATLQNMAVAVVNEPLLQLGITKEEWRLGSMFTHGAKSIIPGIGGSIGTPLGLMKFLTALERGKIVDEKSSLEMKRLLYMTDRRIRYGTSPRLVNAALYFKSGSLYKCKPEEGYECKKYAGNVENYMNSVAIVEHPDGTVYLVVLMSNVLRKNSNIDHQTLATRIDDLIRK